MISHLLPNYIFSPLSLSLSSILSLSTMADGATLSFVLQMLKEELKNYEDLKGGERREFEQLEEELRLLQAFLKDSAKKPSELFTEMEMEKQIRELAYDVEDTIEICLTEKAAAKTKNIFTRYGKTFSTGMAKQVKSLRQEKVKPIMDSIKQKFGSLEKPFAEVKLDQSIRQTPITFIQDESSGQQYVTSAHDLSNKLDKVVDFEDEATIIRYLMEPKTKLDVISITGMPGHGKTTLVRKIFHEETICRKFPLRIWIRVSHKFNSRDAFLNILQRLIPEDTSSPTNEELIRTVRMCLASKEFLLVMDDVWTIKDWEVIQKILPEENTKGKVVVTSRQREVAVQANIYREPHELGFLRHEQSLELLKLKVFGNLESCPPELEDIGKDIANKCGGLPLTIVVIGGILKNLFTKTRAIIGLKEKWLNVFENLNEILEEDKDKSISGVLELSYNTLSDGQRVCFLYTGLFPENHEIPASTLTQLWIAEGFIRPNGRSFEETAEEILDDLINRNLLMVTRKSLDEVKTCRVHDMIREFCKAKAMEENLFRVMKSKEGKIEPPVSEVQNFRRLCLHSDLSKFLSSEPKLNGPRVRSFLWFLEKPFELDPMHISTIPDAFDVLRVLNCTSIKFGQFPKVTKLILLKHITLSIDNLDALPEQISQLLNLRTLIVDTNSRSIVVKANIWKMIQLRRLKTKAAIFLDDKNWTGKACVNLHTVCRLSPESCKETLSKRAPNLKVLGIRGEVANLFSAFSLKKFVYVRKLKLVNELLRQSASPLVLTQPDCFPPNLKSLTLSNTHLKWNDHMPTLANIKSLKVLKLKECAFTGILWDDVGTGFENLQFLLIEKTELVIWKALTTHFPSLRWLVVKSCESLQEIPQSLAKNLEKLELENVKECVANSARKIESIKSQDVQNEQSISGVPFKLIIGTICI